MGESDARLGWTAELCNHLKVLARVGFSAVDMVAYRPKPAGLNLANFIWGGVGK
jgi:hypothetical protein